MPGHRGDDRAPSAGIHHGSWRAPDGALRARPRRGGAAAGTTYEPPAIATR
jgi:hypothetical protein